MSEMSESSALNSKEASATTIRKPARVIGPRLRIVLILVLGLFALLSANGAYLSAVTCLEFFSGRVYQDYFYQIMFLVHLLLGFVLILPVIVFGLLHMRAARHRRNRRAVKIGYALLLIAIGVLVSGVLLTRAFGLELKQPVARRVIYWLHIVLPLLSVWLYWLHRLVGPRIKWYVGRRIAIGSAIVVAAMLIVTMQDPRQWHQTAPKEGDKYFQPSLARTATGNFIPQRALMNDEYCLKCHRDVYEGWFHSAHHFSSFNNPAYLYSVRETRKVALERDGSVQASRWCAGCHDPVPFFTGAFDNPNYDDVNDITSQAGITCTVCHAITHVESNRGNANYVIEEPIQYPFTFSENAILKSVNELLVKAKPGFHKQTFLKSFHQSAEFCSTCHKVHLPKELTHYKDFVRGQDHYGSYLLSGVSGHGAQSFYYPPQAQTNCNGCHMPAVASQDFGAKPPPTGGPSVIHDHFCPGANTALPWWRGDDPYVHRAQQLLRDSTRVDIFGIRTDGTIEGKLTAPLGPDYPVLQAGQRYLIETVIRTLKMGHHLTQGTVDSNELWLELTVVSGDRVLGTSGGISEDGQVDPWSHFVNVFMLDRQGERIARRNAQDIFVPLYNHQIPPGAGQTVHFALQVPSDIAQPIKITAKLLYRKFDKGYIDFMNSSYKSGDNEFRERASLSQSVNQLPITVMAEKSVWLGIKKSDGESVDAPRDWSKDVKLPPTWERWNDYGIGMFLAGNSQLRQAAEAFSKVEQLERYDGPLNLARVLLAEGDLDGATHAIQRASRAEPAPPPWTLAWLSGEISRQQGFLEQAASSFRSVLYDVTEARRARNFDFSFDFRVHNQLGLTLLDLADQAEVRGQAERAKELLSDALTEFQSTLKIDSEDVTAHANLSSIFARQNNATLAEYHSQLHQRYKPDDNAADVARPIARRNYPPANHAAEPLVVYWLHRAGAPGLPPAAALPSPTEKPELSVPAQ